MKDLKIEQARPADELAREDNYAAEIDYAKEIEHGFRNYLLLEDLLDGKLVRVCGEGY